MSLSSPLKYSVLIGTLLVTVALLSSRGAMLWSWSALMGLLVVLAASLGQRILGTSLGILIDGRNRLSLERLQLLAWTILVMSGFLVAICINVRARGPTPLSVNIPTELWLLMGIGTTTLVATPLIHNYKKGQAPGIVGEEHPPAGAGGTGRDEDCRKPSTYIGRLAVNGDPESAKWPDLFTGEEIGDDDHIAMGKVQLAYVTAIVAIAYAIALGQLFVAGATIEGLPTLDNGLVTLLSISNVGHLTLKAIPQT